MAVDVREKRFAALCRWRDVMVAGGHVAPSVDDLRRIAEDGDVDAPGTDARACGPWRRTIAYLNKQVKFGVVDPVSHLPDDLLEPDGVPVAPPPAPAPAPPAADPGPGAAPVPPTPAAPGSETDRVRAALEDWLRRAKERHPELASLKKQDLGVIASGRRRTAEEIARVLTNDAHKRFAAEIAEVVAQLVTPAPAPTAPTPPTPSPSGRHAAAASPPPAAAGPPPTGAAAGPRVGRAGRDQPEPEQGDDTGLEQLDLADYEHTPSQRPVHDVRPRWGQGELTLSWPPLDTAAGTVLYRVVSADDVYEPIEPQDAAALAVTRGQRTTDDRPFAAAVRHVQVWTHEGRDDVDAADAEPVLHARGAVLAQVRDAVVVEDGRMIVGHWTVPPGVSSVQVERSVDGAPREPVAEEQDTRFGFQDADVGPGHRYVYWIAVVARVGERTRTSAPVRCEVTVAAVLHPVTDLRLHRAEPGDDEIVLSWAHTDAEVRVYRTPQGPDAGAGDRELTVDGLPAVGLPHEARSPRRPQPGRDGRVVARVAWPDPGWTHASLTVVVVAGERALVGPTVRTVRLPAVTDVAIIERTHRQVLTFAWPPGAASVLAYVGDVEQTTIEPDMERPLEILPDQYRRYGGMRLPTLPSRGCSVHIVPADFDRGERIEGPSVSVTYDGLFRVWYFLDLVRDGHGQPHGVAVRLRSEIDNPTAPPFVLLFRPDRLPLHRGDGHVLPTAVTGSDPGAVGGVAFRPSGLRREVDDVCWTASVAGLVGYVRVMAALPPDQLGSLALIDPPMAQLYVVPGPPAAASSRWGRR